MAAIIKADTSGPVIKTGSDIIYQEATFNEEHSVDFFYEAATAEEAIELLQPFTVPGSDAKYLVFDTETHPHFSDSKEVPTGVVRRWIKHGSKNLPQDFPFCMSICDGKVAVTLYDSYENGFKEFKKMEKLFMDESIEMIAHNAKFDMHMLVNAGVCFAGKIHDTVTMAKLTDENRFSYQLERLAQYLPGNKIKYEKMLSAYKNSHKISDYRDFPRELLTTYANADVWNTYLVFVEEWKRLVELREENTTNVPSPMNVYEEETAYMMVMWQLERTGARMDADYEQPMREDLIALTEASEAAIYEAAGKKFNINSSMQLYEVLMDLGVDKSLIPMTAKGNPSLAKGVLDKLANVHGIEVCQHILEYRSNNKLLTTYAYTIYNQTSLADRVHCNVNQTEARTGRSSVTDPALQTIPKRDTRIRTAFIPSEGHTLVMMDLDQVEYRILGHYSKEVGIIDAVVNGIDIHTNTAAMVFKKSPEDIEPEERDKGKTANFSIVYGQGLEATANSLKMSRNEAAAFLNNYYANLPNVKPFIESVQRVTRARGFVANMYGRRRRLKTDEVYKAPNALIQGCAADYLKVKTLLIHKYLRLTNSNIRLILTVHDELIFDVPDEELNKVATMRTLMSDFDNYRLPITAGVEMGNPDWGHKIDPTFEADFVDITPEELAAIKAVPMFDGSIPREFIEGRE